MTSFPILAATAGSFCRATRLTTSSDEMRRYNVPQHVVSVESSKNMGRNISYVRFSNVCGTLRESGEFTLILTGGYIGRCPTQQHLHPNKPNRCGRTADSTAQRGHIECPSDNPRVERPDLGKNPVSTRSRCSVPRWLTVVEILASRYSEQSQVHP